MMPTPPPPPPHAPRKRRPRKSAWLIEKLTDGVFDMHIPGIDFTSTGAGNT